MERYKFNTRVPRDDETADQYVTELKLLAKNFNFGSLEDELIKDRVVHGIKSERVRERLLRERELTLDKALKVFQINEKSEEQLKVLNDVQSVKAIGKHNKSGNYRSKLDANRRRDFKHNGGNKQEQVSCCGKCGKSHPAKECPAFSKKCFKCDKKIISLNSASQRKYMQ
ncbi:Hypothetical predicted protein [Paramuricea clavata]|uniref:Uncharacterized protein n=1 Tax=Paramuricea clavata TaxID=317549 RepID=A0A6S7HQR1_PARCT|nr:Hypothetical predicted protein [Paramuricea clavata]